MLVHDISAARRPTAAVAAVAVGAGLALLVGLLAAVGLVTATGESSQAADGVRLRKASPIVLSAPLRVQAGTRIRFTGDVVVRRGGRPVKLQERRGGRWRTVARTTTRRNGTFTVKVSSGSTARKRVFRALAPRSKGLRGLATAGLRIRVTKAPTSDTGSSIPGTADYDAAEALPAGYAAAGSASDWSRLFGSESARWAPCTVITWRYNDSGEAYGGAEADVKRAIAKISGVSGLKFKYAGATSYSYRGEGGPDFPDDADLFVSWANASQYPLLAGNTVGVGGASATSQGAAAIGVDWRLTEGYLTLDKGAPQLAAGFDGPGWGQIIMHETLHALGLGHASGSTQLMAPVAGAKNYTFGAGDITGMERVGVSRADRCAF